MHLGDSQPQLLRVVFCDPKPESGRDSSEGSFMVGCSRWLMSPSSPTEIRRAPSPKTEGATPCKGDVGSRTREVFDSGDRLPSLFAASWLLVVDSGRLQKLLCEEENVLYPPGNKTTE